MQALVAGVYEQKLPSYKCMTNHSVPKHLHNTSCTNAQTKNPLSETLSRQARLDERHGRGGVAVRVRHFGLKNNGGGGWAIGAPKL